MTLYFDMQTRQPLLFVPQGSEGRERQTVTIATLFEMIKDRENREWPKWKRYYLAHREKEIARQKAYRAAHPDDIRKYNRHYYRNRKQSKTVRPGQTLLIREAIPCST